MKKRPDGKNPEGRINRENEEKYGLRAKAQVKTLRYYFEEDWFDDHTLNKMHARNRHDITHSAYTLKKCIKCNRIWNYYLNNNKKKLVQYWDSFKNLPMLKKDCPECV